MNSHKHHKACKRYNISGHAHELTFCCFKKKPFLASERICEYLSASINRARELHDFDLWAYVFMLNHVHLLLKPNKDDYSISKILLSIKQSASRKTMNYLRRNYPDALKHMATGQKDTRFRLWLDGGGYDRNILFPETLLHSMKYIHNNPVSKELVANPMDWKWSSAGEWQEPGSGPISIDRDSFPVF